MFSNLSADVDVLLPVPTKRQKTNSSLLELCEREEWKFIIESMHDLIHVWNFDERNADGNTSLHICCAKGSLDVLKNLQKLKKVEFQ